MSALRLIFMGTPDFAVESLKRLVESPHDVVAVYTQPPRAAGRGMDVKKSPVHRFAEDKNIPIVTPENFKDEKDVDVFRDLDADLAVVAAYGLLLPESILSAPRLGCINIHASLLPRWRGASPIQQAILHGDETSGISIMQMERGLDTGPVLMQASFPLDPHETAGSLHDKLASLAAQMIVAAVEGLASGESTPTPQDDAKATLAPKIKKEDGAIDWAKDAKAIERKVRAFNPFPGTWFALQGNRIRILGGKVIPASGKPGEVMDNQLTIACGEGGYRITHLQREGRKAMTADEFLRGSPVQAATRVG